MSTSPPPEKTTGDSPQRRFTRFVIVATFAASLVNLAAAVAAPEASQPVRVHAEADIGYLISNEQPHVAQRFSLYGDLRMLTDEGTVIEVPSARILDPYTLEHLSLLTVVANDRLDEPLTRSQFRTLGESARYEGENETRIDGRTVLPYVISSTVERPERLVLVMFRDTVVVARAADYDLVVGDGP